MPPVRRQRARAVWPARCRWPWVPRPVWHVRRGATLPRRVSPSACRVYVIIAPPTTHHPQLPPPPLLSICSITHPMTPPLFEPNFNRRCDVACVSASASLSVCQSCVLPLLCDTQSPAAMCASAISVARPPRRGLFVLHSTPHLTLCRTVLSESWFFPVAFASPLRASLFPVYFF